jgi:CubicO group peptidase (beta-lactamase class C family)
MPSSPDTPPRAVAPIDGHCDTRFWRVRDAFARNFSEHDEVGAALCIRAGGMTVVDLWGGHVDADRRRRWRRDTVVNVYSVGKAILAMMVLNAAEQGLLDLDAPVARVWPEFAAQGKQDVTPRMLASHQAGLPAIRERLPAEAFSDWDLMCGALAGQAPYWTPGEGHGYHVNTFGFLLGELVARATGLSVAQSLHALVTGPAEAEFTFGLPASEHARAADVLMPDVQLETEEQWAMAFPPTGDDAHDRMIWHAYFNPSGVSGVGSVNSAPWRLAVVPSTNGHATAREVARLYAAFVSGAPGFAGRGLREEATTTHVDGDDRVLGRPSRFGIGFQLPIESRPLGPNAESFGHYGNGGSLGFADPEAEIVFAYVMNRPGDRWQTTRTQALIDALYACL